MSVYRKVTHTDQYLQFQSYHPLNQKLGVVKTLYHRANTIITKKSDKDEEHQHLRQALNVCGYKDWAINKALKPKSEVISPPKQPGDTKHKVSVTIPYHGDLSEKLRRIYNIKTTTS